MLEKLPGWVISNHDSVERKVMPYRGMTLEQRIGMVASVCRDVAALLELNPNRERVLRLVDPLPASTQAALARLRAQAASSPGGRHG